MKKELSPVEQIEYYLGKDRFKDVYFKPGFPSAYEISATKVDTDNIVSAEAQLNPLQPNLKFKFNNLGYRSEVDYSVDYFKGKKIIVCLGCTDTFGMHDFPENIWPGILATRLNDYEVLNLGIIGASRDTISRLLVKLVEVLGNEIEYACILWPHPSRREFVSKEFSRMITGFDKNTVPFDDYWDFIDWKSNNYNSFKNYHLIKNVCTVHNIKMLDLEVDRFDKKVPFDYNGLNFALGKTSHIAIANYFEKKIKDIPSLFEQVKNDH